MEGPHVSVDPQGSKPAFAQAAGEAEIQRLQRGDAIGWSQCREKFVFVSAKKIGVPSQGTAKAGIGKRANRDVALEEDLQVDIRLSRYAAQERRLILDRMGDQIGDTDLAWCRGQGGAQTSVQYFLQHRASGHFHLVDSDAVDAFLLIGHALFQTTSLAGHRMLNDPVIVAPRIPNSRMRSGAKHGSAWNAGGGSKVHGTAVMADEGDGSSENRGCFSGREAAAKVQDVTGPAAGGGLA